jgi:hypothetical protein
VETTTVTDEIIADLTVLTEERTAELLSVSLNTLKTLRRKGTGPRVTALSTGRLGYRAKDVRAWLDAQVQGEDDVDAQRQAAAKTVLAAVKAKRAGDARWMLGLKGTPTQLAVRLMEACALLEYVASLSDRPDGFIDALEQRATGD